MGDRQEADRYFDLLRELREFRMDLLNGEPSDRALGRAAKVKADTVKAWLLGQFPQDAGKLVAVVQAVAAEARSRDILPVGGQAAALNPEQWRQAYLEEAQRRANDVSAAALRGQASRALTRSHTGRSLAEVTDPFALEVHQPVQFAAESSDLPVLPLYVPRDHDLALERVVSAAADGNSRIAVLVGGSSTGKTRACWEALELLRDRKPGWRLWHPMDPSRPEAALRELSSVGPRTVVWLNEAQFFLDVTTDGLGERVAAGLRELLGDPGRAPVLVLATLWPEFWHRLTVRPPVGELDLHAQARELLVGRDITVPAAFTSAQLHELIRSRDPRLAMAGAASRDGQVVQFLAGAPVMAARYRNAPSGAAALISAAMDGRRLGMGVALPLTFLAEAAPGYLSDDEWDGLGEDWLENSLTYAVASSNGTRGPLARIRPRHISRPTSETVYRLADYLDEYGRRNRCREIPPESFWNAAASLNDPNSLISLAAGAEQRGLFRNAACLRKRAVAQGETSSAISLLSQMRSMYPADLAPAHWISTHAGLERPADVARVLDALHEAGAGRQVSELASRAAEHADVNEPAAVAGLLTALDRVGAHEQVDVLASRAALHTDFHDLRAVGRLLNALLSTAEPRNVEALVARDLTAHADINDPSAVAGLLAPLDRAGAREHVKVLASRAAEYTDLHNLSAVTQLLSTLDKVGAYEQVKVLASRAAAHVDQNDLSAVACLLRALPEASMREHAASLIGEDAAAHASVHDLTDITNLLMDLARIGARKQVNVLASRAVVYAKLDDSYAVAWLFYALQEADAREQSGILADRYALRGLLAIASQVGPTFWVGTSEQRDEWDFVTRTHSFQMLYSALKGIGAFQRVATLIARDPPAFSVRHPAIAAMLVPQMRWAGAHEQADILASRAATQANLENPAAVASLLDALRLADVNGQVAALIARDPAGHAEVNDPSAVGRLLKALREAGAREQVAALIARDLAGHADLGKGPTAAAHLLHALQNAGADQQAAALIGRLPAEGMFNVFIGLGDHRTRYRFGREPDGSPAQSWRWADLE
jgi:hypothetical protein